MEPSFSRYIWLHTSRQQLWILGVVLISMIPYYMAFDLPKMIINGPIQSGGFDSPGATQVLYGIEFTRMQTLVALSLSFLSLVIINGIFKYYINTYKGLLGERLLRRIRFDLMSNWVDSVTVNGYSESGGIPESVKQVLAVTHLLDDVFDFALHSKLESRNSEELDNSVVTLRGKVRDELQRQGLSELVIPFDIDRYNPQAKVLDNIIFGILTHSPTGYRTEEATTYFRDTMRKTGLDEMLVKMGLAIAENSHELFQDVADDHPFFDRLDFMGPEEVPRYRLLYQRTRHRNFTDISVEDRFAWIELSYLYTEPQYRFGLLDDALMQKVVETRKLLHKHASERMRPLVDIYDPERYLASANLIDNILFGKVDHRCKDAERQTRGIIESLLRRQPDLYNAILSAGLEFDVGAAGRRLSAAQRQKFNLARALLRRSDYYIFNRPVSGLDQVQQEKIINKTLYFLSRQADIPGIIWVLASPANARYFDRRITFNDKIIVEDKMLETFQVVPDTLLAEML